MKNHSVWLEGIGPTRESMKGYHDRRIAVVGGSFSGLSTAYHLLQEGYEGRDIAVLDKGYVGHAGGRSAGLLAKSTETDILDDIKELGEERAKLTWNSQKEGIDGIRAAVQRHGLKAGFEANGSRYYGTSEDADYLREEADARTRNDFPSEVRHSPPLGENDIYLFDPSDCTINPAMFCRELADYLESQGVSIFENTPAIIIDDNSGAVCSRNGIVKADKIALAGQNVPNQFVGGRSLPVETYCITTRPLSNEEIRGIGLQDRAIFWDAEMPYFYGKLTPDNRLLAGGGDLLLPLSKLFSGRKKRQLKNRFVEYFPQFSEQDVDYAWGGAVHTKSDFLPTIGNEGRMFYSGNAAGIPHAWLSGKIVASRIAGKGTEYDGLFDGRRKVGIVPSVEGGLWKNLRMYVRALGY